MPLTDAPLTDAPLTDAQCAWIEPLLPDRSPRHGGRWRDHRQLIAAIAWKYQTGAQWRRLPPEYGSWKGDKTARIYQAGLYIAAIFLWTKRPNRQALGDTRRHHPPRRGPLSHWAMSAAITRSQPDHVVTGSSPARCRAWARISVRRG
ncbi:transposase [Streptomyces inhibens]|uniref:transposase n=1 Tax=Streptomyces inhibens TaxID=2293571 RepID=UPI003CC95B02|nr:transposase [Streptomyces inhibens]